MWKIDPPSRRPADEDHYESWTTMARRDDGKCAFGFAATKEEAEAGLQKDIARIEEFERTSPLKRVEQLLAKHDASGCLCAVDVTEAIRALYEELKLRSTGYPTK